MTKLEEMMIKANASITESKSIDKENKKSKDKEIHKHYTDRYNECMKIRDSILNFFKANWKFLKSVSVNKCEWRGENVHTYSVGKELEFYKDYDAKYDFKVTAKDDTNEVTEVRIDKLDKPYYEKFSTKARPCGEYPINGHFYGAFEDEVKRLTHNDDMALAYFERRMQDEEHYWNNIVLPMFEIYLNNVKERQLRKNALLNNINGTSSNKVIHKVTIEIEEIRA